jgi:hypothetical protein
MARWVLVHAQAWALVQEEAQDPVPSPCYDTKEQMQNTVGAQKKHSEKQASRNDNSGFYQKNVIWREK